MEKSSNTRASFYRLIINSAKKVRITFRALALLKIASNITFPSPIKKFNYTVLQKKKIRTSYAELKIR